MFSSSSHGSSNQPAEVFRKDLISAMKLPDSSQLLPDEYMIMTDNWKPEWEKGVQVPVNPRSIPQAHIKEIRKPEDIDFKLTKKFIKGYDTDDEKEDDADAPEKKDAMCQYDLDEVDVHWLDEVNLTREDMGDEPINELTMERIISECDVQCNNNMEHAMQTEEGLGIEYDEDVICDVCRAPDSEEGNEMVFCDKCDICVHQACYGIVNVPEGSWMCRTCALGIQPTCILCGIKGGAMKSTRSGTKWSHVSCALWVPEVSIGCVERMEPITKISQIPASRWALICVICRERTGACIQCSVKTCKTAYHVTCGFGNGLEMKTYLDEEADVRFRSYCQKHTKARREMDGIDGKLGTPDKAHGTPKKDIKEMTQEERANERAIRIQLVTEEFYRYTKLKDIVSALNMKDDVDTVDMVYEYWKLKRKSGHNKPLVTPTKEVGSMGSNEEYNLTARMKMFVHLRQDLERVRNLCYMVQRREKLSRQLSVLSQGIFRKQYDMHIAGLDRYSEEDLEWAIKAGKFAIHLPVSDSEATLTDTSTSTSKDCDTDDRLSKDCDTDDRSERENEGGASERTAETQNGADTDAISSAGEEEERRKDSDKECNEQESEDEKMEVAEADGVVESEEEKDEAVKGEDDEEFELESAKEEEEEDKELETEGEKEVVSEEEEEEDDEKEEVKEEEKEIILKENVAEAKDSPLENLEEEQEGVKEEKMKEEVDEEMWKTIRRRSRAREVEEEAVKNSKTRRQSRSREGDEEKRKIKRSLRENEAEKVEKDKEESWKSKRGLRAREVVEEEKEEDEQVVNSENKRRLRARDIKKEEEEEEGDSLQSKRRLGVRDVEEKIKEDEEENLKNKRRLRIRDEEEEEEEKKEQEEEDGDNWKSKRRLRTRDVEEEEKKEMEEEGDGDIWKNKRQLRTRDVGEKEEEKEEKEEEDGEENRKDKISSGARDVLEEKLKGVEEENMMDKRRLRIRDSSEEEKKEVEEKQVEFKHKKLRARNLEKEVEVDNWKNKRRVRARDEEKEEEADEGNSKNRVRVVDEEKEEENWKNKRKIRGEEEKKEDEEKEEIWKNKRRVRARDKEKEEEADEGNSKNRVRIVDEEKEEENWKNKRKIRAREEEEKKEEEEKEEIWRNKRRVRVRDKEKEEEADEGNSKNRVRVVDEEKEEENWKNKRKIRAKEEEEKKEDEEKLDSWKSKRRVGARDLEDTEEEEKEDNSKNKRRVRASDAEETENEEQKLENWKNKRRFRAREEEEKKAEEEKLDNWRSKRRVKAREEEKEEGTDEGNWVNKRRLRTRNEEEEKEEVEEETWKNKRLRAKEMEMDEENWKSKRRLRIRVVDKKEDGGQNEERDLVNNVSVGITEGKNDCGKESMYEEMEEKVEEEEEEGKEEEAMEESSLKEEEPDEDEDATDLLLQINEKIKEYDEEEEDPVPHLNQVEERTKGVVIKHNHYISNLRLVSPHRSRESSLSNDRCSSPRSADADESDIADDDSDMEHFFIRSSSPLRLESRREEKLRDDVRSETSCSVSKDDEYLEGPFLRPVEDSVTSNDTEHRHSGEGDPPNRPSLKRKISLKAIREAEMRKNGMSKKRKRDSHHRKTKNRKRRSSDDVSDQPVYSIVRTPTRDSPSKISIKIHSPSKVSPKKLQLDEEATKLRQRILISASPRPSLKSYRIPKKKPVNSQTLCNGPAKKEPPEIDPFEFVDELDEPAHKPETRSRKKLIEDEIDSESSCSDRQFENVDKEVSLCVQGRDSPYKGGEEENVTPVSLTTAQANIAREERLKKRNLSSRIRDAAVRFLNSTINL